MSLWRQLSHGLRTLTHRTAADREVSDELDHYLDQATATYVATGLLPEEARRRARMEIGSLTTVHQQVRESAWESAVSSFVGDLRYACRRLLRSPGFSVVSVITLALGIGATTAIFSVVNPILFQSLPYPHAERIVMISDVQSDGTPLLPTFGTYRELIQRSHSLDAAAPVRSWQPTMVSEAEPTRLDGQRVGADYFRALGVTPALGRDFLPSDDLINGPKVVILDDALWRERFAADRSVLGRAVTLDGIGYTIIGVMPAHFENVLAPTARLWAPLQFNTILNPDGREWGHNMQLLARLRPGVSVGQLRQELNSVAAAPLPEFQRVPWASLQNGLLTTSLQGDITRAIRPALLAILGAVLLVLAIACVNVTNLLLARGAQRVGEFAMRAALGAARGRLIRQLLTESIVLALAGGVLGMLLAQVGVRALVALSPPEVPRIGAAHVSGAVLGFGLALTTFIGMVVGLVPAFQAARGDLQSSIQQGSRRTAGGHAVRRSLVVAEVALALVLLVSAGLLVRSVEHALQVPVGFRSSQLLTMQVQATGRRFNADTVWNRYFESVLSAAQQVPGVTAAGFTTLLPLSGESDSYGVRFENDVDPANQGAALRYTVTPGYLEAMGVPLRSGRLLDSRDREGGAPAVLLNESFARRKFPAGNAVGQRLRFGPDSGQWFSVVGVVGDIKQSALELGVADAIYVAAGQWHWADARMSLVARVRGDPATQVPALRRAIWSVDKDQPITRVATMDDLVSRSLADRHFALVLFEAFGLVALVLAATGIYGVISGGVTERMREIGVRSALGASRLDILAMIAGQGLALTAVGATIGLVAAFGATRAITSLLFGVTRLDPLTYVAVTALLLAVSAIACWFPAWRAARVDPVITLRAE